MAAIDQYSTIITSNIRMDGFSSGHYPPLDLSDYILTDEVPTECSGPASTAQLPIQGRLASSIAEASNAASSHRANNYVDSSSGGGGGGDNHNTRSSREGHRVAFRTKSEVEIMDDGFKWRKYGKKSVKNSPNPRNYYRCSTEGCSVKKRVERDRNEPSYVITTYEGMHNHTSPDVVYYATQDLESGRFVVSGLHQIPRSS
ncbi:probable WRKY transcription factor 50 [Asparagus officinalis]|uniref:probable WRKY transcription factor 50 n=1 Tax=Asparagus officinalis TaxID=4686 RepID=UPI00098DE2D8|nr:probable WRKY transcription factor 50 [Asparagus officinalis]